MRNNSLPTWSVGGLTSITTVVGVDAKMLASAGSTAYVYFLDENGRNIHSPVAATLCRAVRLKVLMGTAQQLSVKCVSV